MRNSTVEVLLATLFWLRSTGTSCRSWKTTEKHGIELNGISLRPKRLPVIMVARRGVAKHRSTSGATIEYRRRKKVWRYDTTNRLDTNQEERDRWTYTLQNCNNIIPADSCISL